MLGYYRPQEPEKVNNNKKIKLLLQNLENIVAILKEEISIEEEDDVINFRELVEKIENEYKEPDYAEEDDDL